MIELIAGFDILAKSEYSLRQAEISSETLETLRLLESVFQDKKAGNLHFNLIAVWKKNS